MEKNTQPNQIDSIKRQLENLYSEMRQKDQLLASYEVSLLQQSKMLEEKEKQVELLKNQVKEEQEKKSLSNKIKKDYRQGK